MGTKKPIRQGEIVYIVSFGTPNEMRDGEPLLSGATAKNHVAKWFAAQAAWAQKYNLAAYDELETERQVRFKAVLPALINDYSYEIDLGPWTARVEVRRQVWRGKGVR